MLDLLYVRLRVFFNQCTNEILVIRSILNSAIKQNQKLNLKKMFKESYPASIREAAPRTPPFSYAFRQKYRHFNDTNKSRERWITITFTTPRTLAHL